MTNRLQLGIVVLMALGLVGCGSEAVRSSVPSAPTSPTPPPPQLASMTAAQQLAAMGVVFNPNRVLSGVVFETAGGVEVPVEGVWVYCEWCGEDTHTWVSTDSRGFYSFTGVWGTAFSILARKDGYGDPPGFKPSNSFPSGGGWRDVRMKGDTRFNIELARK